MEEGCSKMVKIYQNLKHLGLISIQAQLVSGAIITKAWLYRTPIGCHFVIIGVRQAGIMIKASVISVMMGWEVEKLLLIQEWLIRMYGRKDLLICKRLWINFYRKYPEYKTSRNK